MKRFIIAAGFALVAGSALAAEIGDLNIVDDSNTARFPENMAPGAVNDGARALEGIIARWDADTDCSLVSTGSSTALSVSATRTLTSYYDGLRVCFESHTDNSGATTLNVDALGAKSVLDQDGATLAAGALANQMKVEVVYDGTAFRILSPIGADSSPDALITAQGDLIRGGTGAGAEALGLGSPGQYLGVVSSQATWTDLPVASTTVSGMQENADQADMESLASTRTVTPDQVVQSPFAAKGWVRFTVSGSAIGTITGQNVTTVAYDSTGDYTVQWNTDFSAGTYTCVANAEQSGSARIATIEAITAGGTSVKIADASGADSNPTAVHVICFGDR